MHLRARSQAACNTAKPKLNAKTKRSEKTDLSSPGLVIQIDDGTDSEETQNTSLLQATAQQCGLSFPCTPDLHHHALPPPGGGA